MAKKRKCRVESERQREIKRIRNKKNESTTRGTYESPMNVIQETKTKNEDKSE